ncbi:MAG: saccharopine dehydrogenase (NAD+, L-lysine-forming) [Cyclobacteriaceae bacterium]|jgi:saccharopine dehydrogenase (NAD+, L-lysine-forming)
MTDIKIGLIKEGKVPIDRRVAMTPYQAKMAMKKFENLKIVAQSSNIRCFSDKDYLDEGIEVVSDISDCDIILGVKEVQIADLLNEKIYFFFSHTIKKQEYNRELLRNILDKKIQLVDYETLTDEHNKRIIAFGRWAGIVGAYNGIWTYGKRYNLFNLRRANECFDLEDLKTEYTKVKLPSIKIAITGGGRVAKGAIEVLYGMNIKKVSAAAFLNEKFDFPVFTQLNSRDYNRAKNGDVFSRKDFYANPEKYESDFHQYTKVTDILIASAYWDPQSPVLFHRGDIIKSDFQLSIVADITCDIEGSIPSTKQPSTIDEPIYDYNPTDDTVEPAISDEGNITVMAVDNLPCELPRDASESFGNELLNNVLPNLLGSDSQNIIKDATITKSGKLTEKYAYLQDYVDGK